jgi:hypothetical protein
MTMLAEWQAGGESWSEVTRLLDVDPRGAMLSLSRCPEVGQLLRLRPRDSSVWGVPADDDGIWSLVWAVAQPGVRAPLARRARHVASVIFFGNDVPRSFAEGGAEIFRYVAEEEGVFRLQRAARGAAEVGASDGRRESRIYLPVEVTVEVLDAGGNVAASEFAVTENVSRRGAALRTTVQLPPGSRVRLKCERYDLALPAVVRASRVGEDKIGRLHVEFVEGFWPID